MSTVEQISDAMHPSPTFSPDRSDVNLNGVTGDAGYLVCGPCDSHSDLVRLNSSHSF